MMRLASSPAVGFGAGAPYCAAGQEAFVRPRQLKEYDEKVLVEIYRDSLKVLEANIQHDNSL
ncbi:hypothetical protein E2562_033966 [Oryza meyeriana var. granulata]|uniref:Uncharacterized protein n=1 Tax=Oryza meyeriana var. granulata TaxID=110450 RepID=A0A6G1C1Q0_9ORYZ|nr:hypothetical protein E2562_033966 [Oryza meyeriana var. granulata]